MVNFMMIDFNTDLPTYLKTYVPPNDESRDLASRRHDRKEASPRSDTSEKINKSDSSSDDKVVNKKRTESAGVETLPLVRHRSFFSKRSLSNAGDLRPSTGTIGKHNKYTSDKQ